MKKTLIAAFALVIAVLLAGCQVNKDDPTSNFQTIARIAAARDAASGQTMFTLSVPGTSGDRAVMIDAANAVASPLVGGVLVQMQNAADGTYLTVNKSGETAASFQTLEGQNYNVVIYWALTDNNGYAATLVNTIPIVAAGETQIYAEISYDPAYDDGVTPVGPAYTITANINGENYDVTGGKPEFLLPPGSTSGPASIVNILYWSDGGPDYTKNTDAFAIFDIGDVLDDLGRVK